MDASTDAAPPAYPLRLTRLARAVAEAKYTVAAVEATAREEAARAAGDDCDPMELFFHCFRMDPASEDMEFICTPRDGVMVVDTVSFDDADGAPLNRGPFAGKTLSFPTPDSD